MHFSNSVYRTSGVGFSVHSGVAPVVVSTAGMSSVVTSCDTFSSPVVDSFEHCCSVGVVSWSGDEPACLSVSEDEASPPGELS